MTASESRSPATGGWLLVANPTGDRDVAAGVLLELHRPLESWAPVSGLERADGAMVDSSIEGHLGLREIVSFSPLLQESRPRSLARHHCTLLAPRRFCKHGQLGRFRDGPRLLTNAWQGLVIR